MFFDVVTFVVWFGLGTGIASMAIREKRPRKDSSSIAIKEA